jgi:hypothetical protein
MVKQVITTCKLRNPIEIYDQVAEKIKNITGINVFDKSRKQPIVDVRSMFCYILSYYFDESLPGISRYLSKNGKKLNHTTVYYNINIYKNEVSKRRIDLHENIKFFAGQLKRETYISVILDIELDHTQKEHLHNHLKEYLEEVYIKNFVTNNG